MEANPPGGITDPDSQPVYRREKTMERSREKIIETYARHIYPGKVEFYRKYDIILVPEKREGCFIFDMNGKRFFNCHCNGGVFNLGHRHPEIIRAVKEGLETYDIGNHHLISKPKAVLGEQLANTMPDGLNQVVYGVSGGEAIDLAIKLARGITGKGEIVSAVGGYHGHTGLAMAAGDARFSKLFQPTPQGFIQVPFNDSESMEKTVSDKTAAVLLETIPATLGMVTPEKDYLSRVRHICDQHGALLILDEVQAGYGRTGTLWGFENYNVVPDMVVLGKGMSGGIYPITATVYSEKHASFFREDPFVHISTFGGSEIGCIAAIETLKITGNDEFLFHVRDLNSYFTKTFNSLGEKYPQLGFKLRGEGLMLGLEFKDEMTALFIIKLLFDQGVYVVYSGNDPKVIQFLPVLTISHAEADEIMNIMESCFQTMATG